MTCYGIKFTTNRCYLISILHRLVIKVYVARESDLQLNYAHKTFDNNREFMKAESLTMKLNLNE